MGIGEWPYRRSSRGALALESNPERKACFGDPHVHTVYSFDAFMRSEGGEEINDPVICKEAWDDIQAATKGHNDPGLMVSVMPTLISTPGAVPALRLKFSRVLY